MGHLKGLATPAEALYQVFAASRPVTRSRPFTSLRPQLQLPATSRREYAIYSKAAAAAQVNQKPLVKPDAFPDVVKNSDIKAQQIQVVDPKTNSLSDLQNRNWVIRLLKDKPRLQREGFDIFDIQKEGQAPVEDDELFLVQVGTGRDNVPICKILQRKALILQRLEKKKAEKEKAKETRAKRPKELEINWAVSPNDLTTKFSQLESFLAGGKKVDVVLANRKRQRKATQEEAEAVLLGLRKKIHEVGARESKPMEGRLLGTATLHIEKNS